MQPVAMILTIVSIVIALLGLLRAVFDVKWVPGQPVHGWLVALGIFLVAFALFLWGPLNTYLSSDLVRMGVLIAVCCGFFYIVACRWNPVPKFLSVHVWPWIVLLAAITFLAFVLVWQSLSLDSVSKQNSTNLERLATAAVALSTPSVELATAQAELTRVGGEISHALAAQTPQAIREANLAGELLARSTAVVVAQAASTAQAMAMDSDRATMEAQTIAIDSAKATIEAQGTALSVVQAGGSKSGGPAGPCRYDASTIELASVPPGVPEVTSGQRILRIWSIQNSGTCTWNGETAWVFVSETNGLMAELPRWPMNSVLPGQERIVDELLVAPSKPGEYRGHWQMVNEDGTPFGATFPIRILVREAAASGTPVPSCRSAALYVSDGSYSDRAERPTVSAGKRFHKAWIMSNPRWGCTWTEDYKLVHVGGNDLSITEPVIHKTLPGETAYLIVDMVAPNTPGVYKSSWKMADSSGVQFGDAVWMEIEVE